MAALAEGVGLIWGVGGGEGGEELFTHLPVSQGQRENAWDSQGLIGNVVNSIPAAARTGLMAFPG